MVRLNNEGLRPHLRFFAVFLMFMILPVMAQAVIDDSSCGDPFVTTSSTATVSSATDRGPISLSVNSDCWFVCSTVTAETVAQVGTDPGGFTYPFGLVSFEVACDDEPPISADVTIIFPGDITGMSYRKYGPTTFPEDIAAAAYRKHSLTTQDGAGIQWYTFTNVTPNGSNTIILHLTEGQLGDDNPNQSPGQAIIIDPGGPGLPPASVPTMTEWGMIVFVLLAGLGSVYYLRRQKRANT